jgi:hypothetical protein
MQSYSLGNSSIGIPNFRTLPRIKIMANAQDNRQVILNANEPESKLVFYFTFALKNPLHR